MRGMHLANKRGLHDLEEVIRATAGEKAQMPIGEAKHGNLGVFDDARGPEERPITTQRDDEVDSICVDAFVRMKLHVGSPLQLDAPTIEPVRQTACVIDGIGARVVGNEQDLHGTAFLRGRSCGGWTGQMQCITRRGGAHATRASSCGSTAPSCPHKVRGTSLYDYPPR